MTEMYGYSKNVMELFKSPRNMGGMKNPDAVGRVGNPMCGDFMVMYLRIRRSKEGEAFIKDAKVKTFGCVAAVSTSSALTEMIKGKTIEYAMKVTKDDVVKTLGGLPPVKYHCSMLAVNALHKAVKNFLKKKSK